MKKILSILLLFISVAAISQPSNYLNIRSRYNLIAIKSDSGFHVPGYSTIPHIRGGTWAGSGNVGVDTVNNKFYFYSGGAWREAGSTNYADSLRRTGLAVQMRKNGNWTTQYIDSVGGSYVFTNGLTESGGVVKLGGTLTEQTTIDGQEPLTISISNIDGGQVIVDAGIVEINAIKNITGNSSKIKVKIDSINILPPNGNLFVDSINTVSSTTGRKVLIHDTATGKVERVDPALLRVVDTSYTTIATFTAGGGFASDTTMCTDSTLFGSFYTGQFDYTVAYIQAVIKGNAGDSIVLKLVYNDTFNVDGTKVNGAGLSVNNRYTGNTFTISTNRTVPANTWLWLKPEAVITGKKPKYISVTLVGYKTYVTP